jgi:hypothetical protein
MARSNFDRRVNPAKVLTKESSSIYEGQSCDLLGFFGTIAHTSSLSFHSNVFLIVDHGLRVSHCGGTEGEALGVRSY